MSTAALLPAMTVCFGSLKFAACTVSPVSRAAWTQPALTASASRPRIAAIAPAPTGTASCIAWARKRTSGSASAKSSAPAATSARVLAERMAGDDGRRVVRLVQPGAIAGDAGGEHHRLGVGGEVELILRTLADQPGDVDAERGRGLRERLAHGRVIAPCVEHADGLRALTGKDEGERRHGVAVDVDRAAPQ